jgi:hypothetical protein
MEEEQNMTFSLSRPSPLKFRLNHFEYLLFHRNVEFFTFLGPVLDLKTRFIPRGKGVS